MLLSQLTNNEKNALFALIALCLPVEYRQEQTLPESSYSHRILHFILQEMAMESHFYEAYAILVDSEYRHDEVERDRKMAVIEPFIQILRQEASENGRHILQPAISLMVILIIKQKYDARCRSMVRQLLCHLIGKITLEESNVKANILSLEQYVVTSLVEQYQQASNDGPITHNQEKASRRSR